MQVFPNNGKDPSFSPESPPGSLRSVSREDIELCLRPTCKTREKLENIKVDNMKRRIQNIKKNSTNKVVEDVWLRLLSILQCTQV